MFRTVEKNQILVKGIMIAVTLSFVVWGIGSYLGMSGDDGYVAKVGSTKIYPRDIDQIMQQNPQLKDKMQVLDNLVGRDLMLANLYDNYMIATTKQMQEQISSIPEFQTNGAFDPTKYQAYLHDNSITTMRFQSNMQEQILITGMVDFFKNSFFSSNLLNQKLATLLSQERNISSYTIQKQQFIGQVKLSDAEVKAYYQANIARYSLPEQVKVQYLLLNTSSVMQSIQISDYDLAQYIEHNKANLTTPKVDVSHILFAVPHDANATAKAAIKNKAEQVLKEVQQHPDQFATYAKQYSEDNGSKTKGGELGFFGKGVMDPAFEKAAFALKPHQISGLVETQFGYHILKLNAVKSNTDAEIKALALTNLKTVQAKKLLVQDATKLNDLTYNQPTSLDPAAKALKLGILTSDWISKQSASDIFANPQVLNSIFNPDAIKNHNNTPVIALDKNNSSYAVFHVVDYKAAEVKPFDQVKGQIINQLKAQKATFMAQEDGQKKIRELEQKKLSLAFTNPTKVNLLSQNTNVPQTAIKEIFATELHKAPKYIGAADKDGNFIIYSINSESVDNKLIAQNLKLIAASEKNNPTPFLDNYLSWLKTKYPVSYRLELLSSNNNANANN